MLQPFGTMLTRVRDVLDPFVGTGRHGRPPADDGTVDPLIAWFTYRGWTILDRDSDIVANFYYPASFGDALDDDNRRYPAADVGLNELECDLYRDGEYWIARFTSCGTIIGCARHRSTPLIIGLHTGVFPAVLVRLEHHARTLHPNEISRCLIFGPCGSNDNPSEPCRTGAPGHDKPALRAVTEREDVVE